MPSAFIRADPRFQPPFAVRLRRIGASGRGSAARGADGAEELAALEAVALGEELLAAGESVRGDDLVAQLPEAAALTALRDHGHGAGGAGGAALT